MLSTEPPTGIVGKHAYEELKACHRDQDVGTLDRNYGRLGAAVSVRPIALK